MNYLTVEQQNIAYKKFFIYGAAAFLMSSILSDPSFAVTVASLQEPMKEFKNEIFGGWMMAVKIGGAATGLVLSVARGSLMPTGIGAGISIAAVLFDKYLGDGASGAFI